MSKSYPIFSLRKPMKDPYLRSTTLHRIIDADTLVLDVDLGYRVYTRAYVRLQGINAYELNTPEGKAGKEALAAFLEGRSLVVQSIKTEKYGRWLALLWVDMNGTPVSVNDWLVEHGHAVRN